MSKPGWTSSEDGETSLHFFGTRKNEGFIKASVDPIAKWRKSDPIEFSVDCHAERSGDGRRFTRTSCSFVPTFDEARAIAEAFVEDAKRDLFGGAELRVSGGRAA